ncbi:glucose-6-phosphate dehydrogenase [Actinotalea sp. K2]|uniref:glucose-6-phosphate dehydrogenase n=1 Tax=Actinotalea sp. K2 TaxID=2939438 RepID=UPI0020182775|nr:glucose-6-phosphate dehydrogenase [Actinotalea sp. K2]MCL3860964.1 glucose-6-phosphate dehydrogenase [Actinotalea sp. K2]
MTSTDDLTDDIPDPASGAGSSPAPLVLVLHGARGDLSRRLVLPALATLQRRGLLPERWALLGTGRNDQTDDEFATLIQEAIKEFGDEDDGGDIDQDAADAADAVVRHSRWAREVTEEDAGNLPELLAELCELVAGDDHAPQDVDVVHYLAVPPTAFIPLTRALDAHDLTDGVRIVYEKPYGTSPESFRELDGVVHEVFDEKQVFRIDHFLGKEAVQNLHVLRFANELFGSIWDRHHVTQVQIDVPETLDVDQRAEFYDETGAALDMLVTHLFQVAAQVAMEPPRALAADDLARVREEVIGCFRPLEADDVVLGQFEGYRDIEGVADDSTTDTFVAARLWIDNERWRGVPFLLRTGKRMAASAQRVSLVLRRDPVEIFGDGVAPGCVSLSLAGDGSIEVTANVKRPGPDLALATGTARLDLGDVETGDTLPAYASLLHDVLVGDRTLFTTPRGLADAWAAFEPLLGPARPEPLPYAPGSWGPAEADALAAPAGWVLGRS